MPILVMQVSKRVGSTSTKLFQSHEKLVSQHEHLEMFLETEWEPDQAGGGTIPTAHYNQNLGYSIGNLGYGTGKLKFPNIFQWQPHIDWIAVIQSRYNYGTHDYGVLNADHSV